VPSSSGILVCWCVFFVGPRPIDEHKFPYLVPFLEDEARSFFL
jgi:hypothetical protein